LPEVAARQIVVNPANRKAEKMAADEAVRKLGLPAKTINLGSDILHALVAQEESQKMKSITPDKSIRIAAFPTTRRTRAPLELIPKDNLETKQLLHKYNYCETFLHNPRLQFKRGCPM
jgi:hypothetical protein